MICVRICLTVVFDFCFDYLDRGMKGILIGFSIYHFNLIECNLYSRLLKTSIKKTNKNINVNNLTITSLRTKSAFHNVYAI